MAQSPRLHTHDLETLRCLATMPQDQQRLKNQGSWPFCSKEWSWSWANFATTVWRKNWYNSEMVVFTKIVIILAVSDGFLKFQKFWHRDTYGMTCSTQEMLIHTQMPHSDTKHAFPLFPPRLYYVGWGVQNCGKIADVILEHFLTRIKLSQSYSFNSLSTHWSTTQIIDVLPGNLSYITSACWWLPPHPP